jgi:hypothetical protein
MVAGLNVGPDFCTVIGSTALLSNGAIAKGGLIFDLDDLDEYVPCRDSFSNVLD